MGLINNYAKTSFAKRLTAVVLAGMVTVTAFPLSPPALAAEEGIIFKTVPTGDPYEGLPLFDGNPNHVEQYLDVYMDYVGLDGMLRYAMDQRGDYQLRNTATYSQSYADASKRGKTVTWDNKNAGKRVPGAAQFTDAVQGVSTDFPSVVGMGQSWNKELISELGTVMGNEKLNSTQFNTTSGTGAGRNHYLSSVNIMLSAAITDIRTNPLSGRIDESFAEDPYLASVMSTLNAQGISGNTLPESEGFWQKAFVDTKHFSNYAAQWWRREGSTYSGVRGIVEYQGRSAYRGFSEGAFSAFMTTYGRTNGVPNAISPMINYVKELSPYRVYTLNDNGAENRFEVAGAFGNGYERQYAPYRVDQMIWQALANASGGHQQNTTYPGIHDNHIDLIESVLNGKYGIVAADFVEIAKAQVLVLVRNGVLNERDENNLPKNYPFADKIWQNTGASAAGQTYNSSTPENKAIALQAAQESVVLLKNQGDVLPLAKDASFIVAGGLADTRYKTTYAGATPVGSNQGLSPLGGIAAALGKNAAELDYISAGKKIAIKAANGKYLSVASNSAVTATSDSKASGDTAIFEVYPWGQADSASLRVVNNQLVAQNGKWLQNGAAATTAAAGNFEVSGMTSGYATAAGPVGVMRREYQPDGSVRYASNTFSTSFFPSFETLYYSAGRYLNLTNPATGALGQTAQLGSVSGAASFEASAESLRTSSTLFTEEVVKEAGEEVSQNAEYAVVVVGGSTRHSAGEGSDRIDLDLGREQYELVENVAKKFPGKTVVVLKTSAPVIMEEIQNNPDVAAIVYQPYAGQYDGYALGQVIFGEYAPTGRLTNTWYADMGALPVATKDMVGEGVERNVASTGSRVMTINDMDPAFKVELNNSDPIDTKLTYMYTDAEITYPFGYGLSYSNFEYSNLQVPSTLNAANGTFDVKVDVANTGKVNTSEIVQLYISANHSPYGQYAPKKQLVSFDKVTLNAGEKKTVTLHVDPEDFAIWNTNKSKLTVISDQYTFSAGKSSEDVKLTAQANVTGEAFGALDAATKPVDVFASTFASSNLTYREVSRQGTMDSLKADNVASEFYAVMSKEKDAWAGIKNVNLTNATKFSLSVASKDAAGDIQLRLDSPTGPLLAKAEVPVTSPVTYNLQDSQVKVTELGYVDVDAAFVTEVSGIHDLYIVFGAPELRLATLAVDGDVPPSEEIEAGVLTGPAKVNSGASLDVAYGLANVNGQDVLAQDITITYDPEKMDFVSIASKDESKFLVVGTKLDEENGQVRVLAVHLGGAQSDPNGNLADLQFRIKNNAAAGITNIPITKLLIADGQGVERTIAGSAYSVQIDTIDRSALINLIAQAETLYAGAQEGVRVGQYPAGSKAILRAAIDQALSVLENGNATAADILQAGTTLNAAMQTFSSSVITSVGGDANGDNSLSVGDLAIVAKAYGAKASDTGWSLVKKYDFNSDGKIDIEDLVWLAQKIFNW
jgi:beta-glucosidase